MSKQDMRCDVCGRPIAPMPPEVDAERKREALAYGMREEELTHVVCDPCWDRSNGALVHEVLKFTRLRGKMPRPS